MNTAQFSIEIGSGEAVIVYRLGFSDKGGELSGFMMQGKNGDDIIAMKGLDESLQKASWSKKE